MTKKTIFSISLKVMGIYSFVQAILLLQPFGMFITSYAHFSEKDINLPAMYTGTLLPSCFLLILCFVLLIFSDGIATKLIGTDEQCGIGSRLDSQNVQSVAFSIVGVVMFLFGIISMVRHGSSIIAVFDQANDSSQLLNIPYIIGFILQLLLGVGLFFGAKPLSMLWHRLKYERKLSRDET